MRAVPFSVIPVKTGSYPQFVIIIDSRFHGNDRYAKLISTKTCLEN